MMLKCALKVVWILSLTITHSAFALSGNINNGESLFQHCRSCHSLSPTRHLTGPSLAEIWGRKAGSLNDFKRYSPALKNADFTWNSETLDLWLTDPQMLVPNNWMKFQGLDNVQARADLIAYLRYSSNNNSSNNNSSNNNAATGSNSSRDADELPDLKNAPPKLVIVKITYCGDAYHLFTSGGDQIVFWEYNLRFKTDSSESGPNPRKPVLVPAGMRGDRGQLVFASPKEISQMIQIKCSS